MLDIIAVYFAGEEFQGQAAGGRQRAVHGQGRLCAWKEGDIAIYRGLESTPSVSSTHRQGNQENNLATSQREAYVNII